MRVHVQLGHEPVAEADLVEGTDAAVGRVEQDAAAQEDGAGHQVEAQQHGQRQQRLALIQEARPGLRCRGRGPGPQTLGARRTLHRRGMQRAHSQLQHDLRCLPPGQRHAPVPEPVVGHEQLRGGDRRGRGSQEGQVAAACQNQEIRGPSTRVRVGGVGESGEGVGLDLEEDLSPLSS